MFCKTIEMQNADCLMCDRIRHNLLNYAYTIVKLSVADGEFKGAMDGSKGFCLRNRTEKKTPGRARDVVARSVQKLAGLGSPLLLDRQRCLMQR